MSKSALSLVQSSSDPTWSSNYGLKKEPIYGFQVMVVLSQNGDVKLFGFMEYDFVKLTYI
jgi:hypothetical protein